MALTVNNEVYDKNTGRVMKVVRCTGTGFFCSWSDGNGGIIETFFRPDDLETTEEREYRRGQEMDTNHRSIRYSPNRPLDPLYDA